MRWAALLVMLGGCQVVFPLDLPPPSTKPKGCSPASMVVGGFAGTGPVVAPWGVDDAQKTEITRRNDQLHFLPNNTATYTAALEPFLEMRGQRFSVKAERDAATTPIIFRNSYRLELVTQEAVGNSMSIGVVGVPDPLFPNDIQRNIEELQAIHIDNVDGTFVASLVKKVPYDKSLHAFWGIEQDGETTRWLTSGDGINFDTFFETVGLVDWVTYMQPHLTVDVVDLFLDVSFSDFNGTDAPIGDACPAGSLSESFDRDVSVDWQRFEDKCAITFSDGEFEAAFNDDNTVHDCGIQTSTLYDLDRPLTLDVLDVQSAGTDARAVFQVETLFGKSAFFVSDGTTVTAVIDDNPAGTKTVAEARYWRFSAVDDDLILDVSANGNDFVRLANSGPGTLGSLHAGRFTVALLSLAGGGVGTDVSARFGGIRSP